jgi:hypothetical protein
MVGGSSSTTKTGPHDIAESGVIEEWSFTKTFTTIRHQNVIFSSILLTSIG